MSEVVGLSDLETPESNISYYISLQDITVKWEKIRHPNTTASERLEIVHDIMEQVWDCQFPVACCP